MKWSSDAETVAADWVFRVKTQVTEIEQRLKNLPPASVKVSKYEWWKKLDVCWETNEEVFRWSESICKSLPIERAARFP